MKNTMSQNRRLCAPVIIMSLSESYYLLRTRSFDLIHRCRLPVSRTSAARFSLCTLLVIALLSIVSMAGPKPPKAGEVLSGAKAKAAEQHKAIFLIFGASWCAECHSFDRYLALPEISTIFNKYFVVIHLNVFESAGGGNASLENAGADQLLVKFGGISSHGEGGFPFFVVLDEKASPLITSSRPTKNKPAGDGIGYPTAPDEIAWFLTMLKRGAPALTADEAHTVESRLQ